MTTPDWPALWAREPGLRPTFEYGEGKVARLVWDGTTSETPPHFHWRMTQNDGVERFFCGSVDGNANCRDAAVRWLAGQGFTGILHAEPDTWHVTFDCGKVYRAPTIDHALHAAARAALDARDRAGRGKGTPNGADAAGGVVGA